MKLITLAVLFLATAALAQSPAQAEYNQLKSLAGSWEGKTTQGAPVEVVYESTAGGNAVMSTIKEHGGMITMFHLDGPDRLMLTHYCSMGNQPRMVATPSSDGKSISFKFLDGTGLSTSDAPHMDHVTIAMLGPDHHTEEWNFEAHGKLVTEVFDLHRKN